MEVKKFTKRPLTVEAVQFTDKNKDQVFHWACQIQGNVMPGWDQDNRPCLHIPTREGPMRCMLGDWLIREPNPTTDRRLYPCKPEIFHATYILAEGSETETPKSPQHGEN